MAIQIKMNIPPFVMNIMERLQDTGHEAYVVGGAVRDWCMDRQVTDWDVATSAPPERIKTLFRDIRSFSLKHGTVTLVDSGRNYEVTTFRSSRGFALTVKEDLGHRDFTINAMAYDLNKKEIMDPHRGRCDIQKKVLRAVGDAEERFQEDPLRLLRAVRLVAELSFKIEQETLKALWAMSDRLRWVAQERIREELMKILLSPKPSIGFNLMVRTGLLKQVMPELLEGYLKRQNHYHRYTIYRHVMETVDRVKAEPVLRWTSLLHDIAKPRVRKKINSEWRFLGHEKESAEMAGEIMRRLKFGKEMIGKVQNLIEHHMIGYNSGWSDGAVRRLIRRVGLENIDDLLAFRHADILAHGKIDHQLNLLSELEERIEKLTKSSPVTKTNDLAINGHKVMEVLGLSPGPEVGKIINQLMDQVIEKPELNTEEGLLAILEKMKL